MAHRATPLRDLVIRQAKPSSKAVRLHDGGGLYLELRPSGGKLWRFKYRHGGKEKRVGVGAYPETSIREARVQRDRLRELVRSGIDPSASRRASRQAAVKAANKVLATFEVVAREWHTQNAKGWAESHSSRVLSRLDRFVFPYIGRRPVADVETPELLECLRRIEAREAFETAHRVLASCRAVFQFAIATARAVRDPSPDARHTLVKKPPAQHFAALTDPEQVGQLLRTLQRHRGTFVVSCALRMAPLVFVRPGELRTAEWAAIDLDAAEWRFALSKTGEEHVVPLATQAVAILRELEPLTGARRYVFPSERSPRRPMSENATLYAMRDLGIAATDMTPHGFRAMARTMLDEQLGERADFIEHQLGHAVRGPLGRAYNRTTHLPERRAMMQRWADYLDGLLAKNAPNGS
jgi:integrase